VVQRHVEARGQRAQTAGHLESGGVVASQVVADTDNEHRPGRLAQLRFTVSSRKWVAHEMQGSWLRIACSQR
jgi:hypothetical protein